MALTFWSSASFLTEYTPLSPRVLVVRGGSGSGQNEQPTCMFGSHLLDPEDDRYYRTEDMPFNCGTALLQLY